MSLIKQVKQSPTTAQRRVQAAVWVLIYGGLLTLITGITVLQVNPVADAASQSALNAGNWQTGECLILAGGLAAGLGVVLIYIRSRMS
jgi:hypothetical protein